MFDDDEDEGPVNFLPPDEHTFVGWEWMVATAMLVMLELDLSLAEVCELKEGDFDPETRKLRARGAWHELSDQAAQMLLEVYRMTWPDFGAVIHSRGREVMRVSAREAAPDYQHRPLFWRPPGHAPIHEQLRRAIAALNDKIRPQ